MAAEGLIIISAGEKSSTKIRRAAGIPTGLSG
jgi:hypothetical protein